LGAAGILYVALRIELLGATRCQPTGSVHTTSWAELGGEAGWLGTETPLPALDWTGALDVAAGSALREQPETAAQSIKTEKEILVMREANTTVS
jgi:hypothetical protein